MNYNKLLNELLMLDENEFKGKNYAVIHGSSMNYNLLMPQSRYYDSNFLQEKDFFHEWRNLEIEKVLRYVHIPSHWHEFMEFVYVVKGTCTQKIDEKAFHHTLGDFVVISPGVHHEIYVPEDSLILTIKVRFSTFHSMQIPCKPHFVLPILFSCGNDSFVQHSILAMYEQQQNAKQYSNEIIEGLFSVLMMHILQNYYESMQSLAMNAVRDYKMIQMLNFMFENYQNITLRGLAENFHYNEMYLSGLLHRETGKTFTEIMKEFRLSQAEELLRTTPSIKLVQVCESIGYNDTTKFIRDFKSKYGITPAKYKKSINP